MIKPWCQNEALRDEWDRTRADADGVRLWWLGQSGYLVQSRGERLLLDPYLSDSLTLKYASTDKPHVRVSERVIAPELITGLTAITSSHNHTDHLDAETLIPLRQGNPQARLVIPEANRGFVNERLKTVDSGAIGLNAGERVELGAFVIHAVPAAHEELETDALGRHRYLGYVIEAGGRSIYHAGDTVRYPGMESWLGRWKLDLALLPINGRLPVRRVSGNLWGREAAQLAHDLGVKRTVPCHYDLFAFNTVTTDQFEFECRALDVPYQVLRLGESLRVG